MTLPEPYFLTNPEWYYYDLDEGNYKLTEKAPQKAIDSYEEYYNYIDGVIDYE